MSVMEDYARLRAQAGLGAERDIKHEEKYTLQPEEAHRFRSILGEAVERLELLNLVTADSAHKTEAKREPAQQTTQRNRKDIAALMEKQKMLEATFDSLMQKRWSLKGLSNKSKMLRNDDEIEELRKLLGKSSKNISQNLKDHPTIKNNLIKIQKDRTDLEEMLASSVNELRGLTFHSLVNLVNRRTEKQRELNDTKNRAERTSIALAELQERLAKECERFDKDNEKNDADITKKTAALKHLKKVTHLRYEYDRKTAQAKLEAKEREYKKIVDGLQNRIKKAEQLLKREKKVNEQTVDFLTTQMHDLDEKEDHWKHRYDEEIKEITNQKNTEQNSQETAFETLNHFRYRWNREKEKEAALAKEAVQREREAVARKRLLRVMNLAQCKIRFWWKIHKQHVKKKEAADAKLAKKKKKKKTKKG